MSRFALLLLPLALSGCVTTHPGTEVASDGAKYSMSCAARRDVDAEYFELLSCSFENKSSAWMDVSVKSVTFPGAEKEMRVASPEETKDFAEAYALKQEKDRHNTEIALAVLALGGAVASGSGNSTTSGIGTGAMVVGLTGMAAQDVGTSVNDKQYGKLEYASGHLLTKSFRVAPGLYAHKALLIQREQAGKVPDVAEVCLSAPVEECLRLPVGLDVYN